MPYDSLEALPAAVQQLPKHAQEIWQAAYNAAFAEYDGDEGKSAATAWAAVKEKYEQDGDGNWAEKKTLSFDEAARTVRGAWYDRFEPPGGAVGQLGDSYIRDVYPDHLIVEMGAKLFSYPYTVGTDGAIAFGEPVEVVVSYVPAAPAAADVTVTSTVLGRFASAVDYVRRVLERLFLEPDAAPAAPAPVAHPVLKAGGMAIVKDVDSGRRRWLGIPTNALYPDAMQEGLSGKALDEAVSRMMASGTPQTEPQEKLTSYVYPDRRAILDIAHIEFPSVPGMGYPPPIGTGVPLAVGTADFVGMCGPFVIATGLEDQSPAGKAFFDYVEANPEEDLRMSHLFEARDDDLRDDGVFQRVDLVRFSVAPASVVANEWTAFALADAKTTGGVKMQMDERLRPFLVGILGEEQVKTMESNLEAYLATAQAAGAEQRTTPPPAAEPAPAATPPDDPRWAELTALSGKVDALGAALGTLAGQVQEAKTANTLLTKALADLAAPAGVTTPPAQPIPPVGTAPAGTKKSVLDDPRYTFRAG